MPAREFDALGESEAQIAQKIDLPAQRQDKCWAFVSERSPFVLGLRIFLHALRMVFGNFPMALRASIPFIAVWVLSAAYAAFSGVSLSVTHAGAGAQAQLLQDHWPYFLLAVIASVAAYLWTAVAWHRYVLAEEAPGPLGPQWHGPEIGNYLWRSFLAGLIFVFVGFLFGFVIGFISAASGAPAGVKVILTQLGTVVPCLVVFFRLSPIFPAAALGAPITFGEAWSATKGATGSLFLLALVSVVSNLVLALPTSLLTQGAPILGLAWSAAVQWLSLMFGVSVLSTIYGHFVEKRHLSV